MGKRERKEKFFKHSFEEGEKTALTENKAAARKKKHMGQLNQVTRSY